MKAYNEVWHMPAQKAGGEAKAMVKLRELCKEKCQRSYKDCGSGREEECKKTN